MRVPWETFYARYRPLACSIAAGITGSASDVEDLAQEGMLALFAALEQDENRFDDLTHARNYFLRAVRNLAMKQRERRRPTQTLPLDHLEERMISTRVSSEDLDVLQQRQVALDLALEALGPEDRDLLERRFLKRKTLESISTETGIAVSTLHSREKSILDRLRRVLRDAPEEQQ